MRASHYLEREYPMSKFLQLSLFAGLLSLGTTLVACGGDDESSDGKAGGGEISGKEVCEAIGKNMKEAGAPEEAIKEMSGECEKEIGKLKEELGDGWGDFAKCAKGAKEENDVEKCMGDAMKKMEEKATGTATKSD